MVESTYKELAEEVICEESKVNLSNDVNKVTSMEIL